jgi:ribosome biogenesis GTPase / thiamine phosphate phosphatase
MIEMNENDKLVERYIKSTEKHVRKQKLRNARRKVGPNQNTKKPPRQKRIAPTDWDDWDDLDDLEFDTHERVMPKGANERRRTVEKQALGHTATAKSQMPPSEVDAALEIITGTQGLVVETSSGLCRVDLNGEILLCDLRGNIRDAVTGYINPVAVGDQVMISQNGHGRGIVETVLPRRSVLARPYSPDAGKIIADLEQIMVANVDRLLIVASWREPNIWPAIIDRYLITAQRNEIEAVICINKTDLIESQAEFDEVVETYQGLGHRIILTSTVSEAGIAELRELLRDSTSVLAGLSGVGKSSLLTAVQPSLDLKTGLVSQQGLFTGQGRHTTTQSSLWQLENGGIVIDTPGVRTFGVAGIPPLELITWYRDLIDYTQNCRFANCTHLTEPECGLKTAVKTGAASALRYKNFTQIFEELS